MKWLVTLQNSAMPHITKSLEIEAETDEQAAITAIRREGWCWVVSGIQRTESIRERQFRMLGI